MRQKLAKIDMRWKEEKNIQERHSDFIRYICNCWGEWYLVDWRFFATIYRIYYLPEVEKEKLITPYKFNTLYIQGVQNPFSLIGIRFIWGQYCVMCYLQY